MRTPRRLVRPFYRRILIQIKVAEAIRLDQAVRVANKASDRAPRAGTWDSAGRETRGVLLGSPNRRYRAFERYSTPRRGYLPSPHAAPLRRWTDHAEKRSLAMAPRGSARQRWRRCPAAVALTAGDTIKLKLDGLCRW
jgi:hypothetical protein